MRWEDVLLEIRRKFPAVPQLSVEALAAWLSDPTRPQPALRDVRAEEEFAVSHLWGARLASLKDVSRARLGVSQGTPLILYCSVGYRSSQLAAALLAQGEADVWNLEGSIFAWANQGRPVFCGEASVMGVHPFDKKWGTLLHPERWAWG